MGAGANVQSPRASNDARMAGGEGEPLLWEDFWTAASLLGAFRRFEPALTLLLAIEPFLARCGWIALDRPRSRDPVGGFVCPWAPSTTRSSRKWRRQVLKGPPLVVAAVRRRRSWPRLAAAAARRAA
ncbi:unnamed protein product, partial [Prorocentrum cordatum]